MRKLLAVVAAASLFVACDKKDVGSPEAGSKGAEKAETAAAAKQAKADAPDAVARQYLEVGAKGDLAKIKDLVDPACAATKVGDVDAVKMLGARMTLTEATTKLDSEEGDRAKVGFVVKGSIEAKEGQTETDILGKPVQIKVSGLSMKGVTQSGSLALKKAGGRWVVTCPEAK